jgi:hypothetical protein
MERRGGGATPASSHGFLRFGPSFSNICVASHGFFGFDKSGCKDDDVLGNTVSHGFLVGFDERGTGAESALSDDDDDDDGKLIWLLENELSHGRFFDELFKIGVAGGNGGGDPVDSDRLEE